MTSDKNYDETALKKRRKKTKEWGSKICYETFFFTSSFTLQNSKFPKIRIFFRLTAFMVSSCVFQNSWWKMERRKKMRRRNGTKKTSHIRETTKWEDETRGKDFFLEKKKEETPRENKKEKEIVFFCWSFFFFLGRNFCVLFTLEYGGTPASFLLDGVLFLLY